MNTEQFMSRKFDKDNYNCAHFAADVWQALTGQDLHERMASVLNVAAGLRKAITPLQLGFKRHKKPVDPCVVIMQSPGTPPHVAIFMRGNVFQIHEAGVEFSPLAIATRSFRTVKFYA